MGALPVTATCKCQTCVETIQATVHYLRWGSSFITYFISCNIYHDGEQYNGTHHLLLEQYRPGVLKANSAFYTDILINIQDQLIVLISFLVVKATLEIVT